MDFTPNNTLSHQKVQETINCFLYFRSQSRLDAKAIRKGVLNGIQRVFWACRRKSRCYTCMVLCPAAVCSCSMDSQRVYHAKYSGSQTGFSMERRNNANDNKCAMGNHSVHRTFYYLLSVSNDCVHLVHRGFCEAFFQNPKKHQGKRLRRLIWYCIRLGRVTFHSDFVFSCFAGLLSFP